MLDSPNYNREIVDSELQVAIIAALKDEIRAFGLCKPATISVLPFLCFVFHT